MKYDGSSSVGARGIKGWMESMFMTLSRTFVGLPFFKAVDYFLNVVEKSAQWSLPAHEINAEENGKMFGKIELLRPLPWILFLPGLVILRIIRVGLNVGAFIVGYPHIEPIKMVKFVQRCRRRLRTLHLKAVKSTRRRMTSNKDKLLIRSIRLTLSTLFCLDSSKLSPSPPPIKICVTGLDFDAPTTPDETSTTESAGSPIPTDKKRKLSEVSSDSETETVLTKLDRYASVNSEDDSDFNPADCAQSSSSSSEDEREDNISVSEVEDIKKDTEQFLHSSSQTFSALPLDKTSCDMGTEAAVGMNETCIDSPGESVYWSARECDDDEEAPFYSAASWTSESETQIAACESNDFINGEVQHEVRDTTFTIPETGAAPSPSTQGVTAGVASQEGNEIPSQEPKSSNTEGSTSRTESSTSRTESSTSRTESSTSLTEGSTSHTEGSTSHTHERKHKWGKKQSGRHTQRQEKRFLEMEKKHSDVVP